MLIWEYSKIEQREKTYFYFLIFFEIISRKAFQENWPKWTGNFAFKHNVNIINIPIVLSRISVLFAKRHNNLTHWIQWKFRCFTHRYRMCVVQTTPLYNQAFSIQKKKAILKKILITEGRYSQGGYPQRFKWQKELILKKPLAIDPAIRANFSPKWHHITHYPLCA